MAAMVAKINADSFLFLKIFTWNSCDKIMADEKTDEIMAVRDSDNMINMKKYMLIIAQIVFLAPEDFAKR